MQTTLGIIGVNVDVIEEPSEFFCQVWIICASVYWIYDPTRMEENYLLLDIWMQRNINRNQYRYGTIVT
jgi:hypothetical protein